jgi:hypothetical protein
MLCHVVEQLNRGSPQMTREGERVELAELNLKYARYIVKTKSASFFAAQDCLQKGIDLLDAGCMWDVNRQLAVDLYTELAKVAFSNGKIKLSLESVDKVFANSTLLEDKAVAAGIKVWTLLNQEDTTAGKFFGKKAVALSLA